jgi:hypothetical protein
VFGIGGGSLSLRIGSAGRTPLPLLLLLTFVCMSLGTGALAASAWAAACPNEQLREQDGYALRLPDCRAYEQVSPVDKNFTDAAGVRGSVQSASSGEGVTFFSIAPFPGVLSAASIPTYISSRGGGGWLTEGLAPPAILSAAGGFGEDLTEGLTEDLGEEIVLVEPGLEAGMAPGLYSYLRNSATGAFRLLGPGIAAFADASADDSRIIFESREQLVPSATPDVVNLYEWDGSKPPGEELTLAGILPDGEAPVGGSVAGPGGPALGRPRSGATGKFYTENTISADGSRVFFSDVGTGQIYMREPGVARTIPVSAGVEPAYWRAATTDGSMVFYTEGEDLYRFNVNRFEASKKLEAEALAEAREVLTSNKAGVLGTLGVSTENGSYVYFVATGVLVSNENGNKEKAEAGAGNLYEWHSGETIFIARLSTGNEYDENDWRDFYSLSVGFAPDAGERASRVAPDGATVLFASRAQLTGYDNADQGELYLYEALGNKLVCVSCNPDGVPATSEAYLASNIELSIKPVARAFSTRNLSEDGSRVFFQTNEALVPQDTNERADVYEWEREGTGGADGCTRSSATFSASSGGCLYLISTGESSSPSYFGDASADGNNVFFFTRQALVGQDRDENYDLYDARAEGGIAAQNPSSQVGCTKEGCLDPVVSSSVFAVPSSATFAGVGSLPPASKDDPRPLTRAQQLARALKACRKQSRKKRSGCEARGRKRYGKRTARKHNGKRAAKAVHVNKPVRKHHRR